MKRYGALLGCVGVVTLIGMAASCQLAALTAGQDRKVLPCDVPASVLKHPKQRQVREDVAGQRRLHPRVGPIVVRGRSRHLELKTLRVTPELYVDVSAVPQWPCEAPDLRGFHPYPECEIVGMPFAGVKMCE